MIRLTSEAFDPGAELNRFASGRDDVGAIAAFVGRARRDGGQGLELESYPGFTETEIGRLADEARDRFALVAVAITHRVGRILPGEAIVQVLTAAAHRQAAFQACDFLMDYLKSAAPLWKKEFSGAGPRWVEPVAADLHDRARWETGS